MCPTAGQVTDVNVLGLNGTHTYINDLVFTLLSPASAAQTILMNRTCGSQDNFNISFDDESPNAAGTWPCPPTNGGTYRPAGSLATFDGGQMQGTWTLKVQDMVPTVRRQPERLATSGLPHRAGRQRIGVH